MNARPMLPAVLMLVVGALAAADNPIPMEVELKDVDPEGETYTEPEAKTTALCVDGCVRVVTKYHKGPTGMASWLEVVPGERTDIIEWAPLAPGQLAPGWVSGPAEDTTVHAFTAKVTGETRIRVEGIIAGERTSSPTTWTVKAVAAKVSPQVLVLSGTQEARVEAELDGPAISDADLRWTLMGSGANLQPGTPQTGRHVDYRSADGALGTRTIALRIGNVGQHACATAEAHVVKIAFDADPGQNYGFDECADDRDEYLSCKRDGKTTFQVTVSNWSDKLKNRIFLKSRDGHFKITGASGDGSLPLTQATTVVEIEGTVPGAIRQPDELGVHLNSPGAPSAIDLHVKLYKELDAGGITAWCVYDSVSAPTKPTVPTNLNAQLDDMRSRMKEAVTTATGLVSSEKQIRYDFNNNGQCDYYNDGNNVEINAITGSGIPGSPDTAIVLNLRDNWRLVGPVTNGATVIAVKGSGLTPGAYHLGSEAITIIDVGPAGATQLVTVSAGVSAHPASDTIWDDALAGLGTSPQLVEQLPGNIFGQVMAHELLHKYNLLDLLAPDNLMHWSAGVTRKRLRYRKQNTVHTGTPYPNGGDQQQWKELGR